jgi:hypothetical protein
MPNPTPQPRQPACALLGAETAASANTPAAAIAVIVVFMFLPLQGMIALRSFQFYPGFLKPRLSIHAPVRDISDAPKPPCVPSVAQIPTQRPESGQPQLNQPSQFVRNLLNAV